MAQSLTGTVQSNTSFLNQNSLPLSVTYSGNPGKAYSKTFSSTDVTKVYFNTYTVSTSTTTVDLTSLTDAYGAALSFTTVKHLQVVNNDTANNLTVGGGTLAAVSTLPVLVGQSGGSCINLTTTLAISGTTKNVAMVASAGTCVVDLFAVGI